LVGLSQKHWSSTNGARESRRLEIEPAADPCPEQHDGAGLPSVADEELVEDFGADCPLGTPLSAPGGVVEVRMTAAQIEGFARLYGTPKLPLALSEPSPFKTGHPAHDVGRVGVFEEMPGHAAA